MKGRKGADNEQRQTGDDHDGSTTDFKITQSNPEDAHRIAAFRLSQ
jgi:hypothetical protein